MTDKEKYRILCSKELSIPIYSRDWWLDCVCGENSWDVLLYNKGEEIEALMPFYSPAKGIITMPAFTQTMGIRFNPKFEDTKYSKNLYRKQQICTHFIERLPSHQYFLQNFHYSFTDWLPFYWKGFRQTTRYNYVLPDISHLDELWKNLSDNIRRNIRKAKDKYKLEVKRNVSIDLFMEINAQTYKRQQKKVYQPEVLKKLIDTVLTRNQGDIWGAFDENGRLHAAVFVVWQKNCAYYIAGGGDSELRQSGAHALAMWEAISDVSKVSDSFDFEGSMIQGVEHFFREFGAQQMPFFTISKGKMNFWKKIVLKIKKLR
ncbi:hypothetical protein FACS189432_01430 [Bacteroidia bacterium]|nr:hypothetical protein FACS189426_05420 [Bacteroidia bacterium]GHT26631.1 hypothetical protein FACS189432_01430 [Bacteroidia bacterium]